MMRTEVIYNRVCDCKGTKQK